MHKFRSPSRSNTGFPIKKEQISAPIPHVDDDEFPIRTPGASIATPVLVDSHERQLLKFQDVAEPRTSGVGESRPEVEVERERISSPLSRRSKDMFVAQPVESNTPRKSTGSIQSHSSISKSPPLRKKSTLKSVLGRLFGRKRKSNTSSTSKKNSGDSRVPQHRSDPTALVRSPTSNTNSQQRSVSLPINEFNRALRSHSVVIDDFPLRASYQPNEPNRQSSTPQAETSFTRPRGATTPSQSYSQLKAPLYGDWTGLSPRPASSHARGSNALSDAEVGEVGVAVTSGSHPNRRSRSLGELRDVVLHPVARRRSDEIRYWRQSHEQGLLSPISSTKPDEDPILVETIGNVQEQNYEPPQPFNFGPMGEMAGMKITQAASLETRVSRLEQRLHSLERFIPQLQQSSTARPTTANSELSLPKHSSPYRPIRVSQNRDLRSSSHDSSRPSTNHNNNNISYQPSFESFPPRVDPPSLGTFHHNAPRPLSTVTTIRAGPPSSSPITKDGAFTAEHYAALLGIIQAEQSARLNLEEMVSDLQQQILILRASVPSGQYQQRGEFSTFSRDESEDEGVEQEPDDFLVEEEVFKTPMEGTEGFGEEGVFGKVSGNRGAGYPREKSTGAKGLENEKKKSVDGRTLSLSQITLKSGPKGVNTNF